MGDMSEPDDNQDRGSSGRSDETVGRGVRHGAAAPHDPLTEIEILEMDETPTVVVRSPEQRLDDLAPLMDGTFSQLPAALADAGIAVTGAALACYRTMPTETVDMEVGFPVDRLPAAELPLASGLIARGSSLPTARIARLSHLGAYADLGAAWQGFMERLLAQGEQPQLPFWEVYVTEPRPDMDPSTLRTDMVTAIQPRSGD